MLLKTPKRKYYKLSLLSAISYRIPLPVTEVIIYRSGDEYSICPRCDCTLDREYVRFCDRCGQRLAWELLDYVKVVQAPRNKQY